MVRGMKSKNWEVTHFGFKFNYLTEINVPAVIFVLFYFKVFKSTHMNPQALQINSVKSAKYLHVI